MAAPRKSASEEDYWFESSASRLKAKVNLFDDSVDLSAARKILKNPVFDDALDDDEDTINWDGSTASSTRVEFTRSGQTSVQSARYRPPGPATGTKGTPGSSPSVPRGAGVPGIQSQSASEPTIDDVVSGSVTKKQPTLTEMAKLEAEINFLNRQLDFARKDRFSSIPVRETVRRIIFGKPYTLEIYRSKTDKLALLDEAIKLHDGNAIIAAVLFLRDTIKPQVFNGEIMLRPIAVQHYINYLRQRQDPKELIDLLSMLGRTDEAAMLKYKQAVSVLNAETKKNNLHTCYNTHFKTDFNLVHEGALILEQIALLERQIPVEDSDAKAAVAGDPKFRENPRKAVILNQSVLTTLYYCCLYHYELTENSLASPAAIKKEHKLSDRQFAWIALNARGKLKKWNDIERLFQAKGWFGSTKMKAVISFDKVVGTLYKLNAPSDILNKYCTLVEDAEQRLQVALKYNCHATVIETFKYMKDRAQLFEYSHTLKPNSQEWFYAQDVLKTSTIKWKN